MMCHLFKLIILCVSVFLDFSHCYINLADVECGRNTARAGRIIGGSGSQRGELPWAASVWRQGAHQCGAAVLSDRWLLTAGHCVCSVFDEFYKSKQLSVVVGVIDLTTKSRNEALAQILPHPQYRCNKKANDVALLQTARPLSWSSELRPACLPQPTTVRDYDGATATVAGWGFTQEDREKGERPDVLQKTEVLVVPNEDCNRWYQAQGTQIKISGTQMCAGYEAGGRDSCWADSGGPLTLKADKIHAMVIGVVSTGYGCGRPKTPGIYTRVANYTAWIVDTVNRENSNVYRRNVRFGRRR